MSATIGESLRHKVVIEFPAFIVVTTPHSAQYVNKQCDVDLAEQSDARKQPAVGDVTRV